MAIAVVFGRALCVPFFAFDPLDGTGVTGLRKEWIAEAIFAGKVGILLVLLALIGILAAAIVNEGAETMTAMVSRIGNSHELSGSGLGMDKSTTLLEQDLYFDDNITLERLSHPVSGKEFLRKSCILGFGFGSLVDFLIFLLFSNEPKELLAKQTRWLAFILLIVIIFIGRIVVSNWQFIKDFAIAVYTGNLTAIVGGTFLALGAVSLATFRNLRALIPVFPESKPTTLDEYDAHNIDTLIQRSSPRWLNDALYDEAWPDYNKRRSPFGASAGKFQKNIQLSQRI